MPVFSVATLMTGPGVLTTRPFFQQARRRVRSVGSGIYKSFVHSTRVDPKRHLSRSSVKSGIRWRCGPTTLGHTERPGRSSESTARSSTGSRGYVKEAQRPETDRSQSNWISEHGSGAQRHCFGPIRVPVLARRIEQVDLLVGVTPTGVHRRSFAERHFEIHESAGRHVARAERR